MDLTPQQKKAVYFLILVLFVSLGFQVIKQNYFTPKYNFSRFDRAFFQKRDSLLGIEIQEQKATTLAPKIETKSSSQVQPVQHNGKPININTATLEELISLPRIGPKTAAKIVKYRAANGEFKQKQDIMKVRGIGKKTFELIKDRITVK